MEDVAKLDGVDPTDFADWVHDVKKFYNFPAGYHFEKSQLMDWAQDEFKTWTMPRID